MLAKDATNNSLVELESVCGDQTGTFEIHSAGYVLKESERISVASSSCDGRRPKPRPDVNRRENPDRMFFFADDRPHLVCLKLRNGECRYFAILEPTTKAGCLFEPSIEVIPGDLLYSGDRTLVQALDARPTGNLDSKLGAADSGLVAWICRHYPLRRTLSACSRCPAFSTEVDSYCSTCWSWF